MLSHTFLRRVCQASAALSRVNGKKLTLEEQESLTCVFSPPAAWEPTLHTPICLCRGTAFLLLGNPTGYLPFHSTLSKANKRWGKSKIQQQILAYADKSIPDSVVTLTRSSLKFSSPSSSPSSLRVPPPISFSHRHSCFILYFRLKSFFPASLLLEGFYSPKFCLFVFCSCHFFCTMLSFDPIKSKQKKRKKTKIKGQR